MTGNLALTVSFCVTALLGYFVVPWLRRIKAGQEIREDGPTWHRSKAGTPTMGGIMFIAGTAVTCVTVGFDAMMRGDYAHIFILGFAMIFGVIGFLDDYEKLRNKRNMGLTAPQKFLLQLAAAAAFVVLLKRMGYLSGTLYIPFVNIDLVIPESLYLALAVFIIVGTVNAVNITDGIDGLASSVTLPVAVFFSAVSLYWGGGFDTTGIFSMSLVGGLLGFLIYNFYPAKVFMGDTGSLFLGGAVCAAAFVLDMPLILVPLGIIYILETLADIIQVVYFKATHGKRFFKMAPLHHHLEMGGFRGEKWSEKKIVFIFTAITALMSVLSFLAVQNRFL